MFLVSACSCLCAIYWSQLLSGEWRCSWSSADRRCSNYIWMINSLIAYWSASYIRDLTVTPSLASDNNFIKMMTFPVGVIHVVHTHGLHFCVFTIWSCLISPISFRVASRGAIVENMLKRPYHSAKNISITTPKAKQYELQQAVKMMPLVPKRRGINICIIYGVCCTYMA